MPVGSPTPEPALEEQVAQLKLRLAQAQKMTALGELLSTTTHEFNNLLTTIINYAKLGMRHKDQPSRDKAFEKILLAANRAARITQTTLGLARNRAPGFEPTDLAQLLDDTLLLLERELQKHRVIVERQIQAVPKALANGNQIQQVLVNLLVNARQAMPNGGRVIVKLLHDLPQQTVDIVIRDTGCGIAPEKLPHIFEPFYTTKAGPDSSGKGGTGLGLSMCREVIEAHHGRIRVESSLGRGTAFTLKLPVAANPAAPSAAEHPVATGTATGIAPAAT